MGTGTQPSKPVATSGTPPKPPATTPNQQATQAKAQCPYLVTKPCDVDTLNVQVIHKYDGTGVDEPTERTIFAQTLERKRNRKILVAGKPARDPALGAYDLVIETIADFNSAETPRSFTAPEPGDFVTINKVQAGFTAPDCQGDQHPWLSVVSKTAAGRDFKSPVVLHRAKVNNLAYDAPIKMYGATFDYDFAKMGVGWFVFFEWVISLFRTPVKEIEIVAKGCGKREKGSTKAINKDLNALVRVYRRDKWLIGLKIPPFGKFNYTKEKTRGMVTGDTVQKTTKTVNQRVNEREVTGNVSGSTKTYDDGKKQIVEHHAERQNYADARGDFGREFDVRRHTRSGRQDKVNFEKLKSKLETPTSGLELVFARNDREIGTNELFDASKEAKQGGASAKQGVQQARTGLSNFNHADPISQIFMCVTTLSDAIASVKDFFRKLPQVGWKFEFDLKVLTGYVVCEWTPKNAPSIDDRYWPVYKEFKFKIAMEVINLKLALSFGIDLSVGGDRWKTGLVAKIEGSIAFKLIVEKDLFVTQGPGPRRPDGPFKFPIVGDCLAALTPYATAYAAGYTVADARCEVNSGFEFKGEFVVDLPRDLGLHGELKTKPLVFTASVSAGWWSSPRAIDPYTILPGTSLKKF
jgi:hypothetical protein